MEKYIPEKVLWKFYEAEQLAKTVIEKAIWEAENTEHINEITKQESLKLSQDREIKSLGEANICIKVAQWRATHILDMYKREDIWDDANIQLRDMLSSLKLENKLLFDPKEEGVIIDHYQNPRRLRAKFRSKILDLLIEIGIIIAQNERIKYSQFRKKIFPYLPHMTSLLNDILTKSPLTLLYFYPKDDTPGCTLEANDFTRLIPDFGSLGIQIVGVSKDSESSHAKFCNKYNLGITLMSDEDESLHTQFGVIGEKKNYGKVYIGVIRSTFLLDPTGKIIREWKNVKATGHAEKVLREIKEMQ